MTFKTVYCLLKQFHSAEYIQLNLKAKELVAIIWNLTPLKGRNWIPGMPTNPK